MIRRMLSALGAALLRVRATIRSFAGVAPEVEPAARVYWNDGVALTLSDLVQETETRASGRVQVITLSEFRVAIGELWDKYEPRILLIAESTIARMMGRGNTFIPQDKDTWLLLFPASTEAEALKRADAIASRIGEKLVGARFTEVPPPLPEASKLDLHGALNADGSLNLDRVKAAVENVRQTATLGIGAAKPSATRPVSRPATQMKSDAAQLTVAFRPAWNAETQSVNSFFFRAMKSDGTNVFAPAGPFPNDATVLELLTIASRTFSDMCERGLRATLTIPVPFPSLQGPLAGEIQRAISGLPQRDRLLHLRLEITHVPLWVGADSLVAIREFFRPYVREVAFLLDPFNVSDQVLALDHIVVGAEIPHGGRRSDEEVFQSLLSLRRRAGGRPTYVLGLSSRLQVAHAISAGIAEIGGSGVAVEMKKLPDHITVIRRQDLVL